MGAKTSNSEVTGLSILLVKVVDCYVQGYERQCKAHLRDLLVSSHPGQMDKFVGDNDMVIVQATFQVA